jgi:hypothetical protein
MLAKGSFAHSDGTNESTIVALTDGDVKINGAVLDGVKITSDSTNFTLWVFTENGMTKNGIGQIAKWATQNAVMVQSNLGIVWENRDNPVVNRLYLLLESSDAQYSSGTVSYELTLKIHRR